jgi:hypothetical protein
MLQYIDFEDVTGKVTFPAGSHKTAKKVYFLGRFFSDHEEKSGMSSLKSAVRKSTSVFAL